MSGTARPRGASAGGGRPGRGGQLIPYEQCQVIGANIRVLRLRNGWTQAELGRLMGWPSMSTVCAAEGRRQGRQRGFSAGEVARLAAVFGVPAWRLAERCACCRGCPPAGFACLSCGARTEPAPGASAAARPPRQAGAADSTREA